MHGAILVIGGGVAGMRAALDVANAGTRVVLVEREAIIGGIMAARLSEGAGGFVDMAEGIGLPLTSQVAAHEKIELLTQAELEALDGEPGHFRATIRQRGRFVTEACTQCNRCRQACPVVLPNEFESGLTYRKAIYSPIRHGFPAAYVIDIDHCLNDPPNYMVCQRCLDACQDNAIRFEMPRERTVEREVRAVIVATGFEIAADAELERFGYGMYPDVLTSIELERLLAADGPTGGFVEKPSNEETPETVLYVLHDNSRFSWSTAASHIAKLAEQDIADVVVLHQGAQELDALFAEEWQQRAGRRVKLVAGELERIAHRDDGHFRVRYKNLATHLVEMQEFDLVVFTTRPQPSAGAQALAEKLGLKLNEDGFVQIGDSRDGFTSTSRPGVYVAGCACGTKDIPESIAEAKAASIYAMRHLDRRRRNAAASAAEAAAPTNGPSTGILVNGRWLSQEEIQGRIQGLLLSLIQPR